MTDTIDPDDLDAVQAAVGALTEQGVDVDAITTIEPGDTGLTFDVSLRAAPGDLDTVATDAVDENVHETEDVQEAADDESEDDKEEQDREDLDAQLASWINDRLSETDEIAAPASAIADEIGVDGRKIPWALKRIGENEGYDVEKQSRDGDVAQWIITSGDRAPDDGAEEGNAEGDSTVEADEEPEEDTGDEDTEAAEDDPDDEQDLVIIAPATNQKSNYHRDEECHNVQRMDEHVEKSLDVIPNHEPCGTCCAEGDDTVEDGEPVRELAPAGTEAREETLAEIAEVILDRIPSVDGGTYVVDSERIYNDLRIESNGAVGEAIRRAKGIQVVDRPDAPGGDDWVVTRDPDVNWVEASTLGGQEFDPDDFEESAEDVKAAAEDADNLRNLPTSSAAASKRPCA